MGRQLFVAVLHQLEVLGLLPGRNRDWEAIESRSFQTLQGGLRKQRTDVAVGNDSATLAEIQLTTPFAEAFEELRADLNLVAAIAERNVNASHGRKNRGGRLRGKLEAASCECYHTITSRLKRLLPELSGRQ